MLEDQHVILEEILHLITIHQVDALLIAGDVYDKSLPSAEAVALLDWFLDQVSRKKVACFITSGNHDSAERIAYLSDILSNQGIYISPVYHGEIKHVTLQDEHGPVTFWLMPFIKPAQVRAYFPDAHIETSYTKACKEVVHSCDIHTDERNVILAHQFVTSDSCIIERSDSELSIGGVDNVSVEVFKDFDYVALGHIHRPQQITRPTCRYSGSILKYSTSEIRYPKSVPLVTLNEKGNTTVELLPLHPIRDIREVKGTIDTLLSPEFSATQKTDDYLRIVITDDIQPPNMLSRLRSVYPNIMAIDHEPASPKATTLASTHMDFDESKSPFELFNDFFVQQNDKPLTDSQAALVRRLFQEIEVL